MTSIQPAHLYMGTILSLSEQKTIVEVALSPLLACPSAEPQTGPVSEPRMVSLQAEGYRRLRAGTSGSLSMLRFFHLSNSYHYVTSEHLATMKTNVRIWNTATGAQVRTAACCPVAIETNCCEAVQADPGGPCPPTESRVPALD